MQRRQCLLDVMSATISSKLSGADKEAMKVFVELSYDQTEAIMEKVNACR